MRCHWSDSWLFVWKTKLHKDETQSTKKEVLFENIFVYRNNVRLWYIWIIFSSPRVSLCLFFPHVFLFVYFFPTCFPLSLFFATCFPLSLFSPGVCLCLFFRLVFTFVFLIYEFFFITSWHRMPFTLHTVAMPEFWVHGVPSNQWCD